MDQNNNFALDNSNTTLEESVDLKQIIDCLMRRKLLIASFSLSGLIIAASIALSTKRTWQGEFQIVLENDTSKNLSININPKITQLTGIGRRSSQLETEVGILKSPAVLMDIFQYVKEQKNNKNLRFKKWQKGSLDIDLQQRTSILNLAYRDKDKDLILPVLDRISNAYQEYSGEKRLRRIELSIQYLEEQIEFYKIKSNKSLEELQKFSLANDLSMVERPLKIDNKNTKNTLNIETIRAEASTNIKIIEEQLEEIKKLKVDSDQIKNIAATFKEFENSNLIEDIESIDKELVQKKLVFKDSDLFIRKLKEEKASLVALLNKNLIGFLSAQIEGYKAKIKASERPEGVLKKYRQLSNKSMKDKFTLDNLETEYRVVLLEKARIEDPWKLITKPTILPSPVAPNRKAMAIFGLLGGILVGSSTALILEKRKNLIYSLSEIKSIASWPLLTELFINSADESIDFLSEGILSECNGSIGIILVGELSNYQTKEIERCFNKSFINREIIFTKDIREWLKCTNLLILTLLGSTNKDELIDINKKLLILKKSVIGVLALNQEKFRL